MGSGGEGGGWSWGVVPRASPERGCLHRVVQGPQTIQDKKNQEKVACCQERRQGSGGEGRKRRGGRGDGERIQTFQRALRDVWDNIKKANI